MLTRVLSCGGRRGAEGGWRQLASGQYNQPLMVGLVLNVFQQLTGINVVVYFAPKILTQVLSGPK